jgi:putative FmdB family regulatory protein
MTSAVAGGERGCSGFSEEGDGMPLYEYDCRKCKKKFTLIVRLGELGKAKQLHCPCCHSTDVRKCIEPFFAVTAKKS